MSVRFLAWLGPIVLTAWLQTSCSEVEGKATEVVVSIEADPSVAQKLTLVAVATYAAGAAAGNAPAPKAADEQSYTLGTTVPSLPFSFGVVKRHDERFLLVVTGFAGAVAVIEHKALVAFVEGETRLLTVPLHEACYARLCNGSNGQALDQTCQGEGAAPGGCAAVGSPPTRGVVEVDAASPASGADDAASAPGPAGDAASGAPDAQAAPQQDASTFSDAAPPLAEAGPSDASSSPGGGLLGGGTAGGMAGGGVAGGGGGAMDGGLSAGGDGGTTEAGVRDGGSAGEAGLDGGGRDATTPEGGSIGGFGGLTGGGSTGGFGGAGGGTLGGGK